MTYASKVTISARGNAVGFDAKGRTITGRKMKGQGNDWVIEVCDEGPAGAAFSLLNGLRRSFANKADAIDYAANMIDESVTAEKAWW